MLLYGRSGIGKTAVAWEMAHAIQAGKPVWGFPTVQTNVLFLELDTPFELVQNRWENAEPAYDPNFSIVFQDQSMDYRQLLSPVPDELHAEFATTLRRLHAEQQYGVVFVDAMREIIIGDLSASGIAKRVYDSFHLLFPGATVVYIHHERKSGNSQFGPSDPIFAASGSMEFINTAQVGIQFHKRGRETFLEHRKTQASAEFEPLPISLRPDGVHVYHREVEQQGLVRKLIEEAGDMPRRELDKKIGEFIGKSEKSGRTLRLAIKQAIEAELAAAPAQQEVSPIENIPDSERPANPVPRQAPTESDLGIREVAQA